MTAVHTAHELERLLPHRAPMLMLTRVLSSDNDRTHCLSIIQANNPLLRADLFPVSGGIELLAQAGGTLLGGRLQNTAGQPGGAIVQIKTFQLAALRIPVGAEIHIHARYLAGTADAALFEGEASYHAQQFFHGTLMLAALPPAPANHTTAEDTA